MVKVKQKSPNSEESEEARDAGEPEPVATPHEAPSWLAALGEDY